MAISASTYALGTAPPVSSATAPNVPSTIIGAM
jgi:hypothetical protein